MNTKIKTLLAAAGLAFAIGGVATSASAATPWQIHHPRRVEVNLRLDRQNERIREERRDRGRSPPPEAFRLHLADHRVRLQERWFARHDGGHLTRWEQARLNHRENFISHRIG